MIEDKYFVSSVKLESHPMKNSNKIIKMQYYYALKYFVDQIDTTSYMRCRMDVYKQLLLHDDQRIIDPKKCIDAIVTCKYQPWRNKYKFWLICDIALIVNDYEKVKIIVTLLEKSIYTKQQKQVEKLLLILKQDQEEIPKKFSQIENLIEQYWVNERFVAQKETKIIVTANMSAGKSTLINALVGKDVAHTAQEVCTSNIAYFYNKAFDDKKMLCRAKEVTYIAEETDIKDLEWSMPIALAVPFKSADEFQQRICLIDTPGVNSAIKREHGKITKKCITSEPYDVLLYVFNANKLGTDEEIAYLKWIAKNVPKEKVVFVLNKLDNFRSVDDNIETSIKGVKGDLQKVGFETPCIFPLSAYFAYLIKKKAHNEFLSEDEEDEYVLYTKKFNKPEYDLSRFYKDDPAMSSNRDLLRKSGIYYLEKKLYGGLR